MPGRLRFGRRRDADFFSRFRFFFLPPNQLFATAAPNGCVYWPFAGCCQRGVSPSPLPPPPTPADYFGALLTPLLFLVRRVARSRIHPIIAQPSHFREETSRFDRDDRRSPFRLSRFARSLLTPYRFFPPPPLLVVSLLTSREYLFEHFILLDHPVLYVQTAICDEIPVEI